MAENTGNAGDFAIPDALPVLPLRDAVVFPLTAAPIVIRATTASSESRLRALIAGTLVSSPRGARR